MIKIINFDKYVKIDRSCTVGSDNWEGLRRFVLQRDKFKCVYCGDTKGPFEADHIKPRSKGGLDTEENLVCACMKCNRSKGAKSLEEWRGRNGSL